MGAMAKNETQNSQAKPGEGKISSRQTPPEEHHASAIVHLEACLNNGPQSVHKSRGAVTVAAYKAPNKREVYLQIVCSAAIVAAESTILTSTGPWPPSRGTASMTLGPGIDIPAKIRTTEFTYLKRKTKGTLRLHIEQEAKELNELNTRICRLEHLQRIRNTRNQVGSLHDGSGEWPQRIAHRSTHFVDKTSLKRPCPALNAPRETLLRPSLILKGAEAPSTGMEKGDVTAEEAPSTAKTKNDPLAERVLAIKMAMLPGIIECPNAYREAPQENMSGIEISKGAVAAAAAEAEPDVEAAEGPIHASRGARDTTVEAARANENADLGAALSARRATATFDTTATLADSDTATTNTTPLSPCRRRITRGAPMAVFAECHSYRARHKAMGSFQADFATMQGLNQGCLKLFHQIIPPGRVFKRETPRGPNVEPTTRSKSKPSPGGIWIAVGVLIGHRAEITTTCLVWKEMVKANTTQERYQVWKVMLQTMDPTSKPWYWKEDIQNATNVGNSHRGHFSINDPDDGDEIKDDRHKKTLEAAERKLPAIKRGEGVVDDDMPTQQEWEDKGDQSSQDPSRAPLSTPEAQHQSGSATPESITPNDCGGSSGASDNDSTLKVPPSGPEEPDDTTKESIEYKGIGGAIQKSLERLQQGHPFKFKRTISKSPMISAKSPSLD
ncbi:hypothetical protein INS49_014382 [Diaporthe citri]|uniref:uncharacterized protein n=1 Tax=Diaporthe citri TaxID=83186 RepID=UPI001C80F810|nr:uncharacterized protein INS49_014382 [Diaporthe citri]KAG6358498.1 hypothetical protein INS49_014382 [Diaporthe citri]